MAAKVRDTTGRPQNVLAKENDINQQISREILPKLPSFVTEYDDFLDTEGRSVKTRRAYLQDILQFFEYMIGGTGFSEATETKAITLTEIEALKGRDVNAYLNYLKRYEDDNGNVIVNGKDARARKRSSIVGLLKYLYRQDLIEHDVTGKIATISVKESERTVKALEENEVMDVLDVVKTGKGLSKMQKARWEKTKYRDNLILTLFVVCGLRISELQQLNISSFNLKREEFTIYRKRGKEAVMPMNRSVIAAFNEYIQHDRGLITDAAPGCEDALFLSSFSEEKNPKGTVLPPGRKRLSEDQIRALVKKYTGIATGGKGVSPHKLRATAATTAIRRGSDISRVASLLDHDSVTTTQRYIKVTEEDKRKVMSTMEVLGTKK